MIQHFLVNSFIKLFFIFFELTTTCRVNYVLHRDLTTTP